jgi:DMSO/TMAO reductase YedYZ molybdopterin-dependent catalytic subunit
MKVSRRSMRKPSDRAPPNQAVTEKFPILHEGSVPRFYPKIWDFTVDGLVENPVKLTYNRFMKLPGTVSISDFYCVTGWSRVRNKW